MTDGASVDTVTWHTKFLLQGLISDSENSSSNLHFTSHHEEYGFCETVCDPSPESLTLELFSLKFFRAAKVVGRRLTNVYLSSPILLMLAPFIVGIFAGWVACRIWDRGLNSSHNQRSHKHKVQKQVQSKKTIQLISVRNEFKNFIHCCYNLFWKHFFHTLTCVVSLCLQIIQSLETYISRISGPRNFDENTRADEARRQLRSKAETERESGVELSHVPRHIAVIMDGNRRYGKAKYGSISKGHWDGSKKLVEFSKWCLAENVEILTVYAFSTENWSRDAAEISSLMKIFSKYCDELREEAVQRGIKIQVLSTETDKLPHDVKMGIKRMVEETAHGDKLIMNICLSYGSRGEIVNACKSIACEIKDGQLTIDDIKESELGKRLLTGNTPDPDIVIRTSGELRLSNFLLWQLAYSEMFFLDIQWPEVSKSDLINIIRSYANGRKRRYGK